MENLQLSRSYFRALVRRMDNPQFPNDETFLKFLLGTPSAIAVFVELITWLPYSKRSDGSIYKSDAQLAHATSRSAKTVERTRKILREAGFVIQVKKANGTPTNHYRLDLEAFIIFAANKLNVKIEQMREWMLSAAEKKGAKAVVARMSESEKAPIPKDEVNSDTMSKSSPTFCRNESPQNDHLDFDILPASLTIQENTIKTDNFQNKSTTTTTEPPPDEEDDVVVDSYSLKMEVYSLTATLKIQYAIVEQWVIQYGLNRVKDVAKHAVEDPNVRNPGGWAKLALANNYQWAEKVPFTPPPKSYTGGPYAAFINS